MIPPIKEPDLALAGLALLIIFGLLIWYDRPSEGFRPSDPYDQPQDHPRTTGYAYESWLWQDPFAFEKPDAIKGADIHIDQCEYQLKEEIKHVKNDVENHVKILAPLLNVWPNTKENKEARTRHRYAVIAGLIESGYRPSEPNRMHFCSSQGNSSNKEYDVRWEHFESKNKSDIIVAWMTSEISTHDSKLPFVLKNLLIPRCGNIDFYVFDFDNILDQNLARIIKPAGAGNVGDRALIKKLTSELELRNIRESSEIIVITEQDSENVRNLSDDFRDSFAKDKSCVDEAESSTCEIKNVFYLKGLDAHQKKINKQDKTEAQAIDKRADRLSAIDLHNPSSLPLGPGQLDYVHRLAQQIKGLHNDIDLQKRNSGSKAVGIFGSNFNDKLLILEALRAEMPNILVFTTELDAQMLDPRYWATTRNLVVASHFNLILKDRDRDRDKDKGKDKDRDRDKDKGKDKDKERYPKQSYQGQFSAFRDSQQTNIFYRTMSMINDDLGKSEATSPQIFEIGRNGFVRLGSVLEKNEDANYHPPDNSLEQAKQRLLLLGAVILVLIIFYWRIRPNSGKLFFWLLFGTSTICAIAWFSATDDSGEPLSFTDGTSLWPSVFIQLVAVLMAVEFFLEARRELDENFYDLSSNSDKQYFEVHPEEKKCGPCLLSEWGSASAWGCFIFLWTFIVYAINDVYPASELSFWPCVVLLVFTAIPYLYKSEKSEGEFNFNSIKHWIEKDNCETEKDNCETEKDNCETEKDNCQPKSTNRGSVGPIDRVLDTLRMFFFLNRGLRSPSKKENYEAELWQQYYCYGRIDYRVSRVVGIWLFFAIIETILIYLLPPWPLPCRGATCNWASWTSVISFVVIMILLFFVLDAVRLSFYWIQKLRKQHPVLAEDFKASDRATRNSALQSLEKIVAVIAERTQVVDRLIYYPMLCIMLMLIAKITYFDNQDFPLSKGITFAASISLLFFSGFMLRYEAEQLKISVIKSAKKLGKDIKCDQEGKDNKCDKEKVDKAIERINDINDGAFQPMFEQPVMRALLIILAFVGIFVSEYLKLLG